MIHSSHFQQQDISAPIGSSLVVTKQITPALVYTEIVDEVIIIMIVYCKCNVKAS